MPKRPSSHALVLSVLVLFSSACGDKKSEAHKDSETSAKSGSKSSSKSNSSSSKPAASPPSKPANSPATVASTPAPPPTAAPTEPAPAAASDSPTAPPSPAAAPAMPASVVSCEAEKGGHFGGYSPTADELVAAVQSLKEPVCLKKDIVNDAIRACAAKLGSTAMTISTDDLNGPSGCQVTLTGAEIAQRKFVVQAGFFRSNASQFDGGTTVVEFANNAWTLYFDALGPDGDLCPITGGGGTPKRVPPGWDSFDEKSKGFLCGSSP
ncbi:MAG: hypothetical protein U0271_43650 [Polyangiaceae bacterium]